MSTLTNNGRRPMFPMRGECAGHNGHSTCLAGRPRFVIVGLGFAIVDVGLSL